MQLNNTSHWWIDNYKINELWSLGLNGKGVKIAVLDTGVQLEHPDLNLLKKNTSDNSQSQVKGVFDQVGHGTHVSGIINSVHNSDGAYGIAPGAELYFSKIRNDEFGFEYSFLIDGIKWAIQKKVDIISISQGERHTDTRLEAAINDAFNASIITVCAAGNFPLPTKQDIMHPAVYKNCIAVGSCGKDRKIQKNSSISDRINILAPGENILSSYKNSTFKKMTGTSQATPYISSLIALYIQHCKNKSINYSLEYFKNILDTTGDPAIGSNLRIINPIKAYENL